MRRRRVVRLAIVLAVVGAWLAAWFVVAARKPEPLNQARLQAYQDAVVPFLKVGGQTVEQGIKPAMTDLLDRHTLPPATIATEARAWVDSLNLIRRQIEMVHPPRQLREAARLFDVALGQYVDAATTFRDAANAPAAGRRAIADRGFATARAADRTYDAASRIIQTWRRKLGLGPTADLPDPETRDASPSPS